MEDSDGDSDYDPRYYVLSNSLYYKHQCFGAGAGSSNIFGGAGSGAVFFVKNGSGLAKNDFLK